MDLQSSVNKVLGTGALAKKGVEYAKEKEITAQKLQAKEQKQEAEKEAKAQQKAEDRKAKQDLTAKKEQEREAHLQVKMQKDPVFAQAVQMERWRNDLQTRRTDINKGILAVQASQQERANIQSIRDDLLKRYQELKGGVING